MSDQYPIIITAISSIFAGSISRIVTHPLDTLKAKLQIQQSMVSPQFITIRQALSKTISSQGLSGLYRGLPISLIGSIPAVCIYFSSYEYSKQTLLQYPTLAKYNFLSYFISGMIAQTCACSIFVPIDVIKQRLQVQSNLKLYKYRGGIDATRIIFAGEGLRGIYKAFGATIASFGPFSAMYFTFYEYFKKFRVGNKKQITFYDSLLCASTAGSIAAWLTNPLDMAKVRMQVVRASKASKNSPIFNYRNMFHGVYLIATQEGYKALFQGALARILFHTPNTAIAMGVTEALRIYITMNNPQFEDQSKWKSLLDLLLRLSGHQRCTLFILRIGSVLIK